MDPLIDFKLHALQVSLSLLLALLKALPYIPLAIEGIISLMPQERTINTTYIERFKGVIQLSSEFYFENL